MRFRLSLLSIVFSILLLSLPLSAQGGTSRISGENRYETAVEISEETFGSSFYAIVATGENWPDALAASGLAGAYNCPVLLSPSDYVPEVMKNELDRLEVKTVFLLGGTGALSENIRDEILYTTGVETVTRLGGSDRYATAAEIAKKIEDKLGYIPDNRVLIVTGTNYPDALSVSTFAAKKSYPVLLCATNYVPASTMSFITNYGITSSWIIGGLGVISDLTSGLFPGAFRIGGADRYETSADLAAITTANGLEWDTVMLATGLNFPDALVCGPYGAELNAPLLLTHPSDLNVSSAVTGLLVSHKNEIDDLVFLGGPGAITYSVENQLDALL